ncbi:hypothetical protein [Cryptosporangium sp. NPDC048952]|uniref:hypothetical protein n=1 Tax=Cryptosporangium sp. NPDC048952 TaxID=3363961 RepID=UPI003712587C
MPNNSVFGEPVAPRSGPFTDLATWLRRSTQAQATRTAINGWYSNFPDRDGMVLSRLRGDSEVGIYQAIDELYAHHLLAQSNEVRYEEDAHSPDFRVYRDSNQVASIEAVSLFPEKSFEKELRRNTDLVAEINRQVSSTNWFAGIDSIQWRSQPKISQVSRWLKEQIASLPNQIPDFSQAEYPAATYRSDELILEFSFIPKGQASQGSVEREGVIAIGPATVGWTKTVTRLRNRISQKVGSKYDHKGMPFALLVTMRDSCDEEDLINAFYGDSGITINIHDLNDIKPIRKRNGVFGLTEQSPKGRNRRLSCVFVLSPGIHPGSNNEPTRYQFNNPFAELEFPDDLLTVDHRFVSRREGATVYIERELK